MPLWPLNTDFQPRLSAASWHSAALPTGPPSPFRAAESTLAVSEWGNICSRSLRHREGAVCQGVTPVQRTGAPPMQHFPARMLAPLAAGIRSIHSSKATLTGKPLAMRAMALWRGGSSQIPETGMGVMAVPSASSLHLPSR